MVVFHLGGAANDPFFAKAERLADLLCAKFPDVTVVKHVQQPDEWKAWAAERAKSLGFDHKGTHMIWTGTGRLIGHVDAFAQLVDERYAIHLEDDFTLFNRIGEENNTAKTLALKEEKNAEIQRVLDTYIEDRQSKIEYTEEILQHLFEQQTKIGQAVKLVRGEWGKFRVVEKLVAAHKQFWEEENQIAAAKAEAAEKRRAAKIERRLEKQRKREEAASRASAGESGAVEEEARDEDADEEDEEDADEESDEDASDEDASDEDASEDESDEAAGAKGGKRPKSALTEEDEDEDEEEDAEPVKRERKTWEMRRFRLQFAKVVTTIQYGGVRDIVPLMTDEFVESLVERTFQESWSHLINYSSDVSRCPPTLAKIARESAQLYEGAAQYLKNLARLAVDKDAIDAELKKKKKKKQAAWDTDELVARVANFKGSLTQVYDKLLAFTKDITENRTKLQDALKDLYDFREEEVDPVILEQASS